MPLQEALLLAERGVFRADLDAGLVYRRYDHPLYTYVRPVGDLSTQGYVKVSLPYRGRKCRSFYAHRFMWAIASGEYPSDAMVVNHINGIKHDNRIANLELITPQGNIVHAYETGLMARGAAHPWAKLSDDQVREARALLDAGATHREVADEFDVSTALVRRIALDEGRFARVAA